MMFSMGSGQPVRFMLSFVSAPKAGEFALRVTVINAGKPPKPKAILVLGKDGGLTMVFVERHERAAVLSYDDRKPPNVLYYCTFRPDVCPITVPSTFTPVYRTGVLRNDRLDLGRIDFATLTPRQVVHHERGRKRQASLAELKQEDHAVTHTQTHDTAAPQQQPHHGVNIPVSVLPTIFNSITDAEVRITLRGGVIVGLTFEEVSHEQAHAGTMEG